MKYIIIVLVILVSFTTILSGNQKGTIDAEPYRIGYEFVPPNTLKVESFSFRSAGYDINSFEKNISTTIKDLLKNHIDKLNELPPLQSFNIIISVPSCMNLITYEEIVAFNLNGIIIPFEQRYYMQACPNTPYCSVSYDIVKTCEEGLKIVNKTAINLTGDCSQTTITHIGTNTNNQLNFKLPSPNEYSFVGPNLKHIDEQVDIYRRLVKLESCTFRCTLNDIKIDGSYLPCNPNDLSPCLTDMSEVEDLCDYPQLEFLDIEIKDPIPGTNVIISLKITKIYCANEGKTSFYLKSISKESGNDWDSMSEKDINTFIIMYLAKYYAKSNSLYYEFPCFVKNNSTDSFENCNPVGDCGRFSALISQKGNDEVCLLSFTNSENNLDFPNDVPYNPSTCELILDGYDPEITSANDICGLNCYWHTDGNTTTELISNHFIGPINGDDFIFKTGDIGLSQDSEKFRITSDGKFRYSQGFNVWTGVTPQNMTERIQITPEGYMGIGALPSSDQMLKIGGKTYIESDLETSGKLKVFQDALINGTVYTKEVIVQDPSIFWPDYVFENKYNLMPLSEIDTYIKTNKHLPNVPTAEDVKENGVNILEMQTILLQKIEELTIHLIELSKENSRLNQKIDQISK